MSNQTVKCAGCVQPFQFQQDIQWLRVELLDREPSWDSLPSDIVTGKSVAVHLNPGCVSRALEGAVLAVPSWFRKLSNVN